MKLVLIAACNDQHWEQNVDNEGLFNLAGRDDRIQWLEAIAEQIPTSYETQFFR